MITIPDCFWQRMLDEFAEERRTVEQVCYFDGIRLGENAVVCALTFPNARLAEGHFEVPADAMSQAGKHFRIHKMLRLAQIHTHPGEWVGHSPWDDQHAYSQLDGAISIVLPNRARNRPALAAAGIHVRRPLGWCEIPPHERDGLVRIVPSLFDFRPQRDSDGRTNLQSSRRRPWWSFLAFWRHQ